jgi:hypothetical protein
MVWPINQSRSLNMKNTTTTTSTIVAINGGAAFTADNRSTFETLGHRAATGLSAEAAKLMDELKIACGDPDRFGIRTIKLVTYYAEARDAFIVGYSKAYYTARGIDVAKTSGEDEKRAKHAGTQAWSMRLELAKINPPKGGRGRPKARAGSGATTRKAKAKTPAAKLTKSQKALADEATAMRKIVNHAEKAGIKCAKAVHKAMVDALTAYNKTLK